MNKLRAVALTVVMITSFTMSMTGSAMNLSVPGISAEFNAQAETVGWMITGYMLTVAALSVPFGRWADITCRKTVLVIGIVIFVFGCFGAVMAYSMPMLLVMRIIQGIGGAMVLSTNTPILLSAYPPNMKGKALGLSIGSVYVGLSLGPVIGGILTHNIGWRSIFIFAGGISIIALVTAVFGLPKVDSEGKGRKMDYAGSCLFAIFIVMFMLGLSKIEGGLVPIIIAVIGFAIGVAFVLFETKQKDPVLNVSLFRSNIGYTLSNVAALMNYAATFAISYLTSIYLQVVLGYSSQSAGFILICQPLIMALLTPKMGKLSDKYSPFKMSSIGMGLCAIGAAFYIFMGEETSVAYIAFALAITGLGFAFFSSPNTNAVMSCVEKKDYGVATSVLNTMRTVGQTSSMVIVTIIVTFLMPGAVLTDVQPETLVKVINISFTIFTLMCFSGVFISLKRKRE